ncbi:MAG: hypothetical protein ABF246_11545 [Winogradskyella sp.]|jgi:hypothetical protein
MYDIKLVETKEEYYKLVLKGVTIIEEQERSFYRHLIETIDKDIND